MRLRTEKNLSFDAKKMPEKYIFHQKQRQLIEKKVK